MIAHEESLGKAEAAFGEMVKFVKQAIQSGALRIDEVELSLIHI